MSEKSQLLKPENSAFPYSVLRRFDDFGVEAVDLARPPGRFWADGSPAPPLTELNLDVRRATSVPSPANLLVGLPQGDTWRAMSRRSLAKLQSWFLVCEDPQGRLDAQGVVTLAHQASLVQFVLQEPKLTRVLIADEVGLGKTIEVGLILRELLAQQPGLRILYFSPARLVRNVRAEFQRMGLRFRSWLAGPDRDATLADNRVIASIHRAAHGGHFESFVNSRPWDVIVVDEAHHLSAWGENGGKPVLKYKLVDQLRQKLSPHGRLILMTGTPHQGHAIRFENLIELLRIDDEPDSALAGRVVYRIKDDVEDWDGRPLFPTRQVNPPIVVDLGSAYRAWLTQIHDLFEPSKFGEAGQAQARVAGWRAGQALQWATSSVHAGLGYLVRQALRAGWTEKDPGMADALSVIRPYRGGPPDEEVGLLRQRIGREIGLQDETHEIEDIEDPDEFGEPPAWTPDPRRLEAALRDGVSILRSSPDIKWSVLMEQVLRPAGEEKIVLFAQPIETVNALAGYLTRVTGTAPALIVGNQSDDERTRQIERFWNDPSLRYLVSSRAGGEGLNLQIARRLVHLDVPWNPMELEQRVGRVHRFLSRRKVIVDTLVVKDSREVHAYRVAREKLHDISRTLVSEDKFESLFSRVMSLVPPEELQDILGERALGPLNEDERKRLTSLISRGFETWKSFHDRFAHQQRELRALDPGLATWSDAEGFAKQHLNATPAEGFSTLRFRWSEGEVVEEGERASVLEIADQPFAFGDYSGMPVTRADGVNAQRLGLNVKEINAKLRELALTDQPAGAAQIRWPPDEALPTETTQKPFGVLVLARQSLRAEQSGWLESTSALFVTVLDGQSSRAIEGKEKARVIRALLRSTVRIEPEVAPDLVSSLRGREDQLIAELRRPSETDRANRIVHAVTPLFAAVVR